MHQTRGELLDEFLAFVTEQNDAEARRIAENVLNRSLQSVWNKHPWVAFTSPQPALVRTVPGVVVYTLPIHFGRLGTGRVRNLTLGRELHPLLQDDYDRAVPVNNTPLDSRRGAPSSYVFTGTQPVMSQPAPPGSTLEVFSSDPGDTDVLLSLVAENTDGYQWRTQVTLTGIAPLGLGTWSTVHEFSKSFAPSVDIGVTAGTRRNLTSRGTVTLQQVGGPILAMLAPDESARQHPALQLDPPPDGAYVIAVPMLRAMRRLTADSDQVPADWGPAVFEDMLVSWRVNTGELGLDANVARPAFLDLVALDNSLRPARSTVPFGVAR